jgi:cytochrome P450
VIPRVATASFEFSGYRVPAGSMVVISPIHTHRMAQWWDDPDSFSPDRFSPQRAEHERHTHSWIPFGGGPHMCIGQRFAELQIKVVMHHMLRSFRWEVDAGYEMPVQQAPISKPQDGLPIRLTALS